MKRILILSANSKDTQRVRLDEEVREIKEGLQRSKNRDGFRIHNQPAVRLRDLRRAMLENEPQIVHFSGHGAVNGIMVEDEVGNGVLVSQEALAGLFDLFSHQVVCVLLNSCYSESQAAAINVHIPYVIGMKSAVPDKAAIEFAVGFYDAMGAGKSIERAFCFGRNAIQLYGFAENLQPVLLKKVNRLVTQKERNRENSERAIDRMLKFAKDNSQPGNWAGFNRLEAEIGSLLWATREAYELKSWPQVLDFRRALGDFLFWKGFWNEGLEIGKLAFDAASRMGDQREMAWCALYPLTRVCFHQGNYTEAYRWSGKSLDLFLGMGDEYGQAAAYRYKGRVVQAQGELKEAEDLYSAGYQKARQFNSTDSQRNLQGHLLAALASVRLDRGEYTEARRQFENALELYRGTNDQTGIAEMLHQLGRVSFQLRNYGEAQQFFENGLKMVESIQAEQMEAEIFYSQALLAEKQGHLEIARNKLLQALECFQSLHFLDGINRAEKLLGQIQRTPGD